MIKYASDILKLLIISIIPFMAAMNYCPGISNFAVFFTVSTLCLSVYNVYYYFIATLLLVFIWKQIFKENKPGLAVIATLFFLSYTGLFLFFQYAASSIEASKKTDLNSTIRIVSANVHLNSALDERLAQYVSEKNADIVVLLEVSPIHLKEIDAFFNGYPYKKMIPQNNAFGLAVFSKYPATFNTYEIDGFPYIAAQIDAKGTNFNLYAVHTMPPMAPTLNALRKTQIDAILHKANYNSVVIGDFNALAHDSVFQNKPVQLVPLKSATWPDWGLKFLGIGIDHAFVSKDLKYKNAEVGPRTNSDHYPIYVEVGK